MKKLFIILMAFSIFTIGFLSCERQEKHDVKVGFVYVGSVGDKGYSWTHDQGRLAVEAMGVPTIFLESVPGNADAETALNTLKDFFAL